MGSLVPGRPREIGVLLCLIGLVAGDEHVLDAQQVQDPV